MSSKPPALLDPWRAADTGLTVAGTLPLARCERLRDALFDRSGEVRFRLAFGRDDDHRAVVTGEVEGSLVLCCQRCLGPLVHEVDADLAMAVVGGTDEARALPERYDPLLVTDASIRVADLIEDELILSLPQIPTHEAGVCDAAAATSAVDTEADRESPFAVLAAWREKR